MSLPTTPEEIIKKTAEELNLPEKVVSDLVNLFYKKVRQVTKKMTHSSITIRGIGRFDLKGYKIQEDIDMLEGRLKNKNLRKSIRDRYEEKLVALRRGLSKWEVEQGRKEVVRKVQEEQRKIIDEEFYRKNKSDLE